MINETLNESAIGPNLGQDGKLFSKNMMPRNTEHETVLKKRSQNVTIKKQQEVLQNLVVWECVGMLIYLTNIYFFLRQVLAILWNSPTYFFSFLDLTFHIILPVWAFMFSAFLFQHTTKKYYNVIVKKDNMDRQPDVSDRTKIIYDKICKGYLWLIPTFIGIYFFFLVTKAMMGGEWTKMRQVTWWIYFFGVLNLWPSWCFSAYWLLRQRCVQKDTFLHHTS